jgi:hypothetical protein
MVILSNYPTDRCDFRIVRGVQNEILFFVRDLDRNSANTTLFSQVTITIVDWESATVLLTRNLSVVDAPTALYQLTILASETANWDTGPLRWTITVTRMDGSVVPLWTDMNYSANSVLEVTAGPTPPPASPIILNPSTWTITNMVPISDQLPGSAQLGYQNGVQTFAVYPSNFTGSLEIDGTLAQQPGSNDWFAIQTNNFVAANTLSTINVIGNYIWLRLQLLNVSAGSITQILYKN